MAILPEYWGNGINYTMALLDWLFANTPCQKLIAFIPEKNQKMLALALKSGLKKEGFIENSFLSGGVLHGQNLLGITKGDVCHQQ
jgi:RimJ/RimL family protein N-acetyltransferase